MHDFIHFIACKDPNPKFDLEKSVSYSPTWAPTPALFTGKCEDRGIWCAGGRGAGQFTLDLGEQKVLKSISIKNM